MPNAKQMEIEVEGGVIRGALHLPRRSRNGSASAAVIICRGVHAHNSEDHSFTEQMTEAITGAGIAAAVFDHRCADLILDDFDVHTAARDAEDAQAVHRWVIEQAEIDRERIGVLGYSLGAIAAAALAREHGEIARLCMLAPVTAAFLHSCIEKPRDAMPFKVDHLPAAYGPSLQSIDSPRDAAVHAAEERPMLVIGGAADRFVTPEIAMEYVKAVAAAGGHADHILIARAGHAFANADVRGTCVARIALFFKPMAAAARTAAAAAAGS